jgi:FKBP-type peptidyl-prolyl cis-trans isomerase FklB
MKTMKFVVIFSIALLSVAAISCKEDEYVEWKIVNQSWLDTHKNDPGFVQTESGLCYKVIHQGYMTRPTLSAYVQVKYTGSLVDGTVFESSDDATFQLASCVGGWIEGLRKMNTGGHFIFYFPYTLGYGKDGSGARIPPYSTLIFDVELIAAEN